MKTIPKMLVFGLAELVVFGFMVFFPAGTLNWAMLNVSTKESALKPGLPGKSVQVAAAPALRVEGMIRHPPLEQPLEYFVIIAIRNDRGEEVTRQVVNVGALQAAEKRTFTLSVEVLPPQAPATTNFA